MGAARLLAKGWIAFCVFAGAHALQRALAAYVPLAQAAASIGVCVVLFVAMGLLFVGGYGASSGLGGGFARLKPRYFLPGFNEIVFTGFAAAIFFVQTTYAPGQGAGGVLGALEAAIRFAVPGQRALESVLGACALDGGRSFASAFAWLLAFVFLGSGVSRLRLAAALVRLERKLRGAALGAVPLTFALGLAAVVGIQLLFVGTAYTLVPCDVLSDIPGAVLIGLGPLALAYLIVAALTNLLALSPEA
jgi:hypothetical protein